MDIVLTLLLKSVLDLSVNFNSRPTASVSVNLLAGAINNAIHYLALKRWCHLYVLLLLTNCADEKLAHHIVKSADDIIFLVYMGLCEICMVILGRTCILKITSSIDKMKRND
jgi:hypothetical protein